MGAEEFFKESVVLLRKKTLTAYTKKTPEHTFSPNFEKAMQDMIAKQRMKELRVHTGNVWRQATCFVLSTAAALCVCFLGVNAWSNDFLRMVVEDHTTYSSVYFDKTGHGAEQTSSVQYTLTAVPEGFRRTSHGTSPDGFLNYVNYENDKDQYIRFDQSFAENIGMGLNTEGAKLEELEFRGHPARFLENKGWYLLFWNDDKYVYQVDTNLSREETMKLGEDVKLRSAPFPSLQELPIELLPQTYDVVLARENGDVLVTENGVENLDKLTAFIANCAEKKDGSIRVALTAQDNSLLIHDLQMQDGRIYYTADEHRWEKSEQPWEIGEEYDSIGIFENAGTSIVLLYTMRKDMPQEVFRYDTPK